MSFHLCWLGVIWFSKDAIQITYKSEYLWYSTINFCLLLSWPQNDGNGGVWVHNNKQSFQDCEVYAQLEDWLGKKVDEYLDNNFDKLQVVINSLHLLLICIFQCYDIEFSSCLFCAVNILCHANNSLVWALTNKYWMLTHGLLLNRVTVKRNKSNIIFDKCQKGKFILWRIIIITMWKLLIWYTHISSVYPCCVMFMSCVCISASLGMA